MYGDELESQFNAMKDMFGSRLYELSFSYSALPLWIL